MLGPSGSGKTTTLRMIAGFEIPDEGTIELAGEDVSRLPPYDRPVNTVFQDYALFPHMTVQQNVEYGLMVKKVKKGERQARAREALEMVRLGGYGDRKPGTALGRATPARRARARDRQPPEGAPPRRAARRARPQAPPGDADRAQVDPARGRHHLRVRDARPGRGADDVGPARGVQPGQDRADRAAGGGVRASAERVHRRVRRGLERDRARRPAVHGAPREAHAPGGGRGAGERVARRGGNGARRPVRRAGDAIPRYARPRRRAAGTGAEPRGGLERGARGRRDGACASRGAPGRSR